MKQKIRVSMIGALVVIISAVVLITGCPQPNSNKGNNSGNTGGSSINFAGTVWYSGGYGYLYFSSNKAYMCYHNNGTVTINSSGTYSKDKMIMNGESISILSITESVLKIPAPNEIDTITYTRETDISLINKIKSACH
ncbi:hypothetical protein E4O05_06940 [Treponema sp. OMZ 787]|uniref:hypothetical protein n=1 Tax=Treponema sp. OMZ 787 TaxID=2563669 RepID=UPI0020A58AB7|nr:hypothetical protein [Treponema sp. OMZ 787]UTC61225.1 hypothetical protein E4O05_06940 [Treponema sp. OMZ 787]